MSTSIRNRLAGTITNIISDNVVSELTINLKVGDNVFAIIKATEVSVEKE